MIWISTNKSRNSQVERQDGKLKRSVTTAGILVLLGVILYWSFRGTGFNARKLWDGFPMALDFVRRSFPPAFSTLGSAIRPIAETIQMSILSTALGAVIAAPISLLAARNMAPSVLVYIVLRGVMNVVRSLPSLLIALLFVSMVGLGAFPGTLALTVVSSSILTKLFSEAVESIDEGQVEAVQSTGASRVQTLVFAVIPQVLPLFLSHILYVWEINVRAATVLGLVGAGGVGFVILSYMRLFKYREAMAVVTCVVLIVAAIDAFSRLIRKKLI